MKEDSGSIGQGWLTCTNMCLCENVLDSVCMHVHVHVCTCRCARSQSINEVALVLQALTMALVSPAWSPRQILPAFSQIQNLMQDVTWDSRHPPPQLKTKLPPKEGGWLGQRLASGLRHIHAHAPGGKRTIRSENSMQIS